MQLPPPPAPQLYTPHASAMQREPATGLAWRPDRGAKMQKPAGGDRGWATAGRGSPTSRPGTGRAANIGHEVLHLHAFAAATQPTTRSQQRCCRRPQLRHGGRVWAGGQALPAPVCICKGGATWCMDGWMPAGGSRGAKQRKPIFTTHAPTASCHCLCEPHRNATPKLLTRKYSFSLHFVRRICATPATFKPSVGECPSQSAARHRRKGMMRYSA
jgi:hypothetical protein